MILIDTSVWVDYLRNGDDALAQLLQQGQVCIHPMIIGELACGHLQNRKELMTLWQNLPSASMASHDEVLFFLENNGLMGRGIGWVDLHLLAATLLTSYTQLWTNDRRLKSIAQSFEVDFPKP